MTTRVDCMYILITIVFEHIYLGVVHYDIPYVAILSEIIFLFSDIIFIFREIIFAFNEIIFLFSEVIFAFSEINFII